MKISSVFEKLILQSCIYSAVVEFLRYRGGVITVPWWNFYGTMVEFETVCDYFHRGALARKKGRSTGVEKALEAGV